MDGLTLVKRLGERGHAPPVIMMTAYGSERIAVEAMKAGAYDYVSKPYDVDELRCLVQNALETVRLRRENETLRNEIRRQSGFGLLIGRSRTMDRMQNRRSFRLSKPPSFERRWKPTRAI